MDVKLVALDIDGTLAADDKNVMPETLEALLKIQDKGVRLAIASARPTMGLMRYSELLHLPEHGGVLMSYSGGRITDAATGEIKYNNPLDVEETRKVLKLMDDLEITTMIDDGENFYAYDRDGYLVEFECVNNNMPCIEVDDLSAFEGYVPMKLNVAARPEIIKEMKESIASFLPDDMIVNQTEAFYMEVIPKNGTKGHGIRELSRIYGIPLENIVAFGDSESDLTMIRAVGMGVAMGNGSDKLKREADLVTAGNNEEGIARALEIIFDGK